MDTVFVSVGAAIWLGILTSISPCPLATNIAAISYVGRKVDKTRWVLFAGLLYTLGRAIAYAGVAVAVTRSMQLIPGISNFLQKYMNLAIGPLLILVGILLLDVFRISFGGGMTGSLQKRVDTMGVWGALLLGIVFALAFCPVSAGLFFGGLIPLALQGNAVMLASLYAIGTALPVILFALLLAFAANRVGAAFNKLTVIEIWVRRITAVIMMLIGIVLVLKHNFGIYLF
ncbi:MAG: aromatic aminobenezylarsenical efflux permease ArsG family transporter [Chitinispirillaceae bacterium]|jgi:cytochrome c biogenesis protein CcdA|nr:aromatic aminobenezylarsenical efflux permease ArsG family transporter [Chitinispirillaceae bacterium]